MDCGALFELMARGEVVNLYLTLLTYTGCVGVKLSFQLYFEVRFKIEKTNFKTKLHLSLNFGKTI